MLVASKRTDDDSVILPDLSRRIDHRLRRYGRRKLIAREERHIARSRQPRSEFFFTDRSAYTGCFGKAMQDLSLLNLHSLIGFVDYSSFFAMLPPDKPVVWTLHDVNPFTGGCLYTAGCDKFTLACGACPVLGSKNAEDLASSIFRRKRAAYHGLSPDLVRIVAPSRWLAAEAKRSTLFRQFEVATIPNGLDTELFQPRDKAAARELFGISPTCKVVMFVAEWLGTYRKGIDLWLQRLITWTFRLSRVGIGRRGPSCVNRPSTTFSSWPFDGRTAFILCLFCGRPIGVSDA